MKSFILVLFSTILMSLALTNNVKAQPLPPYIEITVYDAWNQLRPGACVWVTDPNTGERTQITSTDQNGKAYYSLIGRSAGNYVIEVCYPCNCSGQTGGTTYYYDGIAYEDHKTTVHLAFYQRNP